MWEKAKGCHTWEQRGGFKQGIACEQEPSRVEDEASMNEQEHQGKKGPSNRLLNCTGDVAPARGGRLGAGGGAPRRHLVTMAVHCPVASSRV